ncbi:MAG: hypothetical protein HY283_02625 [Nitrospirae bacterium]|nr:hypothetical protein [Nitrospirota bacterium]
MNCDGRPDLIVGAPSSNPYGLTSAGSAFVYKGGSTSSLLFGVYGTSSYNYTGTSVSLTENIDGQYCSDVIIGSPGHNAGDGSATIYDGYTQGFIKDFFGAPGSREYLGYSVSNATVWAPGVIVGAPFAAPGGRTAAGSAYVYTAPNSWSLSFRLDGYNSNDRLGWSAAGR